MKIYAHTCFIGTTGYANHARSFFLALNKFHEVKVRNLTIGNGWRGYNHTPHDDEPYITQEMKDMLIVQSLYETDGSLKDYPIYGNTGEEYHPDVNIILMDNHNPYFYQKYEGHTIAFNVWESTRYPQDFFDILMKFDEMWVPSQWQVDCLIEQGYPANKISLVTEGVDIKAFKPIKKKVKLNKFRFLLFGRWDYRKSTTNIIRVFGETFKGNKNVELICSVENPFPYDGIKTTEERLEKNDLHYDNVKFIKFTSREEYVKYLQEGNVFVSCARSEGWNLPLIEAMACGTPSIYSNWGAQLQFAKDKGLPVKITGLVDANIKDQKVDGQYCEPDFEDLGKVMMDAYQNYDTIKKRCVKESKIIHEEFNWEKIAKNACKILEKKEDPFLFVTTGNLGYMPVIEKMVQSVLEFSKSKIIVYGVDCDVPFNYPNVIKRRIDPPKHSELYDRWYWKQYACIESLKEGYEKFVWIDGDVVINNNFNNIDQYFKQLENYPITDIHIQEDFLGFYHENEIHKSQRFNERLSQLWNIERSFPIMHVCMYIYNKKCKWWFEEIIRHYNEMDLKDYYMYFLWNDESIDNAMRWKYGFKKHLPNSNFDTSSYDGNYGFTHEMLQHFYKFWNERGPQNFNRVYGYQYIPEDKSKIIYFHGNKDVNVSDKMIEFIKMKRDNNFFQSEYFYTSVYNLENLGDVKNMQGGTMDIAVKYGWHRAIYHEIYNLQDYYLNREKRIHDGDVVVDIGANMGIFTRWAYKEGASKVIAFEPDSRYFRLLKLNSDPRSILFNAAVSDEIGTTTLYESSHFGGSNIFWVPGCEKEYTVRTYTLDYLFESGLIDKIDFLKVDTEGAEIGIFKGISDENLMKVNAIAMEYHHSHLNYNEKIREDLILRFNKLGFNSFLLSLGNNNALQMLYLSR